MKVLSLGSICLDILVQSLSEFPQPNHGKQVDQIKILGGGGALNTAIALKRLGVDVYAMGEIGFDYAGDMILNIMQEESINTKL
jgi:ribokinase